MDVLFVIILALSGAMVPDPINEFKLESGKDAIVFSRVPGSIWLAEKINGKDQRSSAGEYKLDGLIVGTKYNGDFIATDVASIISEKSIKEIITLNRFTINGESYGITKVKNGFSINTPTNTKLKVSWRHVPLQ